MSEVPLAEQISWMRFIIAHQSSDQRQLAAGVLATLQQHERALADLDATTCVPEDEQVAHQDTVRLWQEAKGKTERAMAVVEAAKRYRDDATGELSTLNALWGALDALDDAASAVATPAGKGETGR